MKNNQINRTFLIFILGILAAIGPFTIDMYLPGFKSIADDFHTDEKHVAFTLTSYFIGIAIGQLFYGPIVDKYGRKKPLIIGLMIYVLAAFGISLSPNIETMIVLRFVQALGGCVGIVVSSAVITDVYEVDKRAQAFSSIMLVMGVAPLIAPSIGSFFIGIATWHYIFYFLGAFALLVMLILYFFLPETSLYMHSNKLKVRTILSGYFSVLKNNVFLNYTIAGSIVMSVLFAYISSASFIFLTYFQLDTATFSIIFAINASGLITGSYVNGLLTKKVNFIRIANTASAILLAIAGITLSAVYFIPDLNYKWVVLGIFSILFAVGFVNPNATAASLAPFAQNAGIASALGGALRMGTGALVASVIGLFQGETPVTMFLTIFILVFISTILLRIAPKKLT